MDPVFQYTTGLDWSSSPTPTPSSFSNNTTVSPADLTAPIASTSAQPYVHTQAPPYYSAPLSPWDEPGPGSKAIRRCVSSNALLSPSSRRPSIYPIQEQEPGSASSGGSSAESAESIKTPLSSAVDSPSWFAAAQEAYLSSMPEGASFYPPVPAHQQQQKGLLAIPTYGQEQGRLLQQQMHPQMQMQGQGQGQMMQRPAPTRRASYSPRKSSPTTSPQTPIKFPGAYPSSSQQQGQQSRQAPPMLSISVPPASAFQNLPQSQRIPMSAPPVSQGMSNMVLSSTGLSVGGAAQAQEEQSVPTLEELNQFLIEMGDILGPDGTAVPASSSSSSSQQQSQAYLPPPSSGAAASKKSPNTYAVAGVVLDEADLDMLTAMSPPMGYAPPPHMQYQQPLPPQPAYHQQQQQQYPQSAPAWQTSFNPNELMPSPQQQQQRRQHQQQQFYAQQQHQQQHYMQHTSSIPPQYPQGGGARSSSLNRRRGSSMDNLALHAHQQAQAQAHQQHLHHQQQQQQQQGGMLRSPPQAQRLSKPMPSRRASSANLRNSAWSSSPPKRSPPSPSSAFSSPGTPGSKSSAMSFSPTPGGSKASSSSTGGAAGAGISFVNFTSGDAKKLMKGVAPSGSSKRRREEAAEEEQLQQLQQQQEGAKRRVVTFP